MSLKSGYWTKPTQRLGRRLFALVRYSLPGTVEHAKTDLFVFRRNLAYLRSWTRIDGKRVLDIGCGTFFPQVLLLSDLNCRVVGLDSYRIIPTGNPFKRLSLITEVGPFEFIQRFLTELIPTSTYYKALSMLSGTGFDFKGIDVRQGKIEDIACMFGPESFDIIISNAVLEHVSNLDTVCGEMDRVLKHDGVMLHNVHLFPSLSGGHNLPHQTPSSVVLGDVPPWDHLRENKYPPSVRLNHLREHEYRMHFEKWFRILDWRPTFWEPRQVLTPAIQAELKEYSTEELLKRGITVIAGKK